MFLRRICSHLVSKAYAFNCNRPMCHKVTGILGTYESDLLDKWKEKFTDLNVPEIDLSLEYILMHVLDKEKVSWRLSLVHVHLSDSMFQLFSSAAAKCDAKTETTFE